MQATLHFGPPLVLPEARFGGESAPPPRACAPSDARGVEGSEVSHSMGVQQPDTFASSQPESLQAPVESGVGVASQSQSRDYQGICSKSGQGFTLGRKPVRQST
eukprot:5944446-Alexandrium_andersonii.AAC.1